MQVESARALLASMHALGELGRFDEAIAAGESARAIFIALDEPALAARADINLGITYQRRDEPELAVACFERARAPLTRESQVFGQLENSRGEALVALNDFRGADAAFQSALESFENAGGSVTAAIAEGNLADLAARQGDLRRSLYHFEQARRRFEAGHVTTHLARLLSEQADAKAILGLPGEALAEYEANLPALESCGLALEAARARAGMGLVLLRLGRPAEAATALAAAAMAFEELGHATARAKVDLARAELLASSRRVESARSLAYRSLSVLAARPADSLAARHLLARLAAESGDTALALSELDTAVSLARELDLAPLLADLLHTRGRLHAQLGDCDRAIADLSGAVESIERLRGTLQAERLRTAYLGDRAAIYEDLIGSLLDSGRHDDVARAVAMTEKAKSRALLDQISTALALGGPSLDEAADSTAEPLQRRLIHVQADLNGLYSRMAEVESSRTSSNKSLARDIRTLEDELDAIRARLSLTSGSSGLMAPTASLEQVQRAIPDSTVLIEYMTVGEELLAFVIGPKTVVVRRHIAELPAILHHLARFRFQIDRALRPGAREGRRFPRMIDDCRAELAALYDLLVAPLAEHLDGAEQLTLVPHGPLHLVPFHALWNGEQYLVQVYRMHTAPSASIFCELAAAPRASGTSSRALVVGVADETAPQIAEEALAVARTIGDAAVTLLDERATVDAVTRAALRASILHLACHGRFLADAPLSCGLRLADRWLTVRDIYAMGLEADLVTLSGCETGVNSVTAGDELMGLLRGFFGAGARSLLASLWRAHDGSTAEFMCRFYTFWQQAGAGRGARASALQRVQREMLERWPHPAHWAPFVLVGRS